MKKILVALMALSIMAFQPAIAQEKSGKAKKEKSKKGKVSRIDLSNDGNGRGSDVITMIKFSPNERLLGVCNDSSIKIFEVRTLI